MKLDLRENMYVRTKDGKIHKIKSINDKYIEYENSLGIPYELKEYIVKASYNIIDILKVGDYINTERIDFIVKPDMCGDEELNEGKIHLTGHERYSFIYIKDIETIVTKEQFNDITYKMKG